MNAKSGRAVHVAIIIGLITIPAVAYFMPTVYEYVTTREVTRVAPGSPYGKTRAVYRVKRWRPHAGKPHGRFTVYFPRSRMIRQLSEQSNGEPVGVASFWNRKGEPERQIRYGNGAWEIRASPPWWIPMEPQRPDVCAFCQLESHEECRPEIRTARGVYPCRCGEQSHPAR